MYSLVRVVRNCFSNFKPIYRITLKSLRSKEFIIWRRGFNNHYQKSAIMSLVNNDKTRKKFGNTDTLRHVKHKERLGGKLPISGVISLQVVGTGGFGSPRSVILSTEHNKYLFNCGEGTQRVINEHKMKASRLEHIFITHKSWSNVGGLLGMALTLQAVNVPSITIHGPPDVEKGVLMSRSFADMKAAGVHKVDLDEEPLTDHTLTIEPVKLIPTFGANMADVTLEPECKRMRMSDDRNLSVAYICRPRPYPRKVDLVKCVELGIKSGPLLGKLKSGECVTLDDGRVISPEQILGEQMQSRPILILEVPSLEYLDSLLESQPIAALQAPPDEESEKHGDDDGRAEVVVHLSDTAVIRSVKYQEWMTRFCASTRHLMFDEDLAGPTCKSPYRYQAMLNQIHPIIFPLLYQQTTDKRCFAPVDIDGSTVHVSSNLVYNYRPRKHFDTAGCITLDYEEYLNESRAQNKFTETLAELKTRLHQSDSTAHDVTYPHLVFLGTGSSVPSNTRNVSAILLHLSCESCIMLDCGEGTLGQLWRFYGQQTTQVLAKLNCILISHLHADHHLGVFSLLLERHRLHAHSSTYAPLDLVAPGGYRRWATSFLTEFTSVHQSIRLHENHLFLPDKYDQRAPEQQKLLERLQLKSLWAVPVRHCKGSFGFVMELADDRKITYSGDTMPCDALIDIGKNSHLLIHEATMEDDLEDEAKLKTHSTTSQAIDVGVRMNAHFTLLTHFSQRYAKIPVFNNQFSDKVGIAFDNMRVSFNQLPLLPLFIPALKTLFAEHYAEMEEKIERRQVRARALEMAKHSDGTS